MPAGHAAGALERFRDLGYRGVNVTTPLKEEAFARCDARDALALASGSVNTVVFERGSMFGANTDGAGAVAAVREATGRDAASGVAVLVLGAGPTARAAARALVDAGAAVTLWNRTRAREEAACAAAGVRAWTPLSSVDAVLSALSPGGALVGAVRAAVLRAPVVIDANYGVRATLGADLARPVVDGHAMLRASARASFALFAAR